MHSFIFFINDVQTAMGSSESMEEFQCQIKVFTFICDGKLRFFQFGTNLDPDQLHSSKPPALLFRRRKFHFSLRCHQQPRKSPKLARKQREKVSFSSVSGNSTSMWTMQNQNANWKGASVDERRGAFTNHDELGVDEKQVFETFYFCHWTKKAVEECHRSVMHVRKFWLLKRRRK